jgi:hypothetical protein
MEDYLLQTQASTANGYDKSILGLLVGLRSCWTLSSFLTILFSQKFYFLAYERVDVVQNLIISWVCFGKPKKQMIWQDYEIQTVFSSLFITSFPQSLYRIDGGMNGE